jgi:site-specific DNA-methyltransferase (adenine-specific)
LSDDEWGKWSDSEISRICRVTHPFVGRIRKELLVTVTSSDSIRTYIHPETGKKTTMNIANIGRKSVPIPDDEPEPTPDFFTAPLPEPKPEYDPLTYRLFVSPITELSEHIEPDSIDAIITDPPYPKEYIHTYEELAEQASIVLKPGGILVAMAGHPYIDILIGMMKKHLHYQWLGCYYMPTGPHSSLPFVGASVYWKPLIIMSKGAWPKSKTFQDVVINDDADKRYHEWGQGISGFTRIVEMFTFPNQTVLDPFVGGGTTAIASLKAGRYFIGCDISPDEITKTEDRLHG